MKAKGKACPFCGERVNGQFTWACGTYKKPDTKGKYTVGARCDANCFRKALLEVTAERDRLREAAQHLVDGEERRSDMIGMSLFRTDDVENLRHALTETGDDE